MIKLSIVAAVLSVIANQGYAQTVTQPETRKLTSKEISSFNSYYRNLPAKAKSVVDHAAPDFFAIRMHGEKQWTITASVPGLSEHGAKNLCKRDEYHYRYLHKAWQVDTQQSLAHTVWLDIGADCNQPLKPITLNTPLPDADVMEMLSKADALLNRSTIMMRGNTECSLVHVGSLALTAIGTGTSRLGTMLEFDYSGNAQDRAALFVRKLGADMSADDMHCTEL